MNRLLRSQLLFFIIVRIVLNTALRMIYPFLPAFGRGLGVSLTELSRAVALRSAAGIFGPFLASVADRRGRKFGMVIGLVMFILATGVVTIWPSFIPFILALVFILLGYFVYNPSMQAYIGDKVPYARRGTALALIELGWSLSLILGVPAVGLLIAHYGWQAPFSILCILGILSLFVLAVLLPKDEAGSGQYTSTFGMLSRAFSSPSAWTALIMGLTLGLANELVALIFGVWLEESFSLNITALGATAALIGSSELVGELLSAGYTDRIGKTRSLAIGLLVNCLAAALIFTIGSKIIGALLGLFLFFLSFEFTMVSSIPLLTEVTPLARATFMASFVASVSLGRAFGDILAPWLYQLGRAPGSLQGIQVIALSVILWNGIAMLPLRYMHQRFELQHKLV